MRLQKNTMLALYSVLEFASAPERPIAAAEIAERYGVSAHHLAKVLAELARSGILASVRGAGGGYRFTGNAKRLTLLDIIQRFEDVADPHPAKGAAEAATPVDLALGTVLAEIDLNARATFGSITLATMNRLIARQQVGAAAARTADAAQPDVPRRSSTRGSRARSRARVDAEG